MAFYSGRTGSITVGGSSQPLNQWGLDYKCDPIETTNFDSKGYAEHVYGIRSADISASGPYDGSAGAQPGTGDKVTFALSTGTGGPSFSIDAVLTSVKIDVDVKDVAKISYTATSTGEFTITV